jgi:uncharacterized protein
MAEDLMRYDLLAQDALRGVVRSALAQVAVSGLPGEHHLFIALDTRHREVQISDRLRQKYPEEITIVLQHQFWNLEVRETEFSVELTFDNVLEKLVLPYTAIKGFFDPAVQFGLQFETKHPAQTDVAAGEAAGEPPPAQAAQKAGAALCGGNEPGPAKESESDAPKVVSLDQFRKK